MCVARQTNVSVDELLELFVFESNFGLRAQQTLQRLSETFRAGWGEIFTGKRIHEIKYMNIRRQVIPLLVYEKKNTQPAAAAIASGSLTFLSTSLAGAPTAPAVPAAPPKRKSEFENYFSSAPIASAKKQKSSGGASSGMNSHERDAAVAASSSNASAGAGARQLEGQSAVDAITID